MPRSAARGGGPAVTPSSCPVGERGRDDIPSVPVVPVAGKLTLPWLTGPRLNAAASARPPATRSPRRSAWAGRRSRSNPGDDEPSWAAYERAGRRSRSNPGDEGERADATWSAGRGRRLGEENFPGFALGPPPPSTTRDSNPGHGEAPKPEGSETCRVDRAGQPSPMLSGCGSIPRPGPASPPPPQVATRPFVPVLHRADGPRGTPPCRSTLRASSARALPIPPKPSKPQPSFLRSPITIPPRTVRDCPASSVRPGQSRTPHAALAAPPARLRAPRPPPPGPAPPAPEATALRASPQPPRARPSPLRHGAGSRSGSRAGRDGRAGA